MKISPVERRLLGIIAVAFLFCALPLLAKEPALVAARPEAVGRLAKNRYLTPTNQVLTPAGHQVDLPEMRPQALALSPDGKLLVTAGKTPNLVAIDPATGELLQKVALPPEQVDPTSPKTKPGAEPGSQLSLTGLVFSPDSARIYLSNVAGNVKVFAVDKQHKISALTTFAVPEARTSKRKMEIPAGLAVSADSKRLYVVGNLANQLHELDAESGKVLRSWDTGVAPFEVALAVGKAYVSNSGGRRPDDADLVAPAGRGTTVRVDPVRYIASEGSVTVIDLIGGKVKAQLVTGLHASAIKASPNRRYVVVANTGSDTLTVIDTKTDQITEKIWTRQTPADLFGAQPNALAFDRGGKRLFVCNGTQNAVAVIKFEPEEHESKVLGLIPVGWFPGAIEFDEGRKALCVANIKGIGVEKVFKPGESVKLNSKDFFGTVSLVPVPKEEELAAMTQVALLNMRYPKLEEAKLPARPDQAARPVPGRVGEPSMFKHVVYVIKENRSYDQVLGDMKEGNGDAGLCIFGEKFTPNQHKIAREFVLLDNTYCSGVQSADGHQWTDSAIANAYMERQVTSAFPRSYPGGKSEDGIDALAWASSGFIWDNALAHGKTFRNYGEWMMTNAGWKDTARKDKPAWQDFWDDFKTGAGKTKLASQPAIESLRKHSKLDTVGWDLNVPDVVRAAEFSKELKQFEATGVFPNLVILFLPNDHTGGTRGKAPTPAAQIADNDLALGQVVEALSHSSFWPETCLFAVEDDPQAGWDHVSGYRTTCYVASPYTKRGQTISSQYNQTSLMRTIELIVGLPPMNQLDATATPMSDCFIDTPDLTPFASVPNQVPLDQLNPAPKKISDRALRKDAIVSARLPLEEADRCPEDVLNGILWRAMKGPAVPFPKWAATSVKDDH
ncbi:MAG: alkaline phosphatase family protein [Chthoniobacter sp.]|uniref:bifunctional YncE family protein/alkaline phosphatase family protein n=1 Tax=Chthoniobacter sp. TaxID=2510640 RepID=UPI0032A7A6BD